MITLNVRPGLVVRGYSLWQTSGKAYMLNGRYYVELTRGEDEQDVELHVDTFTKIRV